MAKDKKRDLPYMPFYVGDWLKCPEVRALPPDYRGLWFDLLCYMWESTERGVMVTPNGRPYTDSEIIRMVGLDNQNSGNWLTSLLTEGVCSRRDDGAIFSKRMVRDEKTRQIRRETGAKGGNPTLLDKGIDNSDVNQNTEDDIDYDNVVELYHELCPKMRKVEKLGKQRREFIHARFSEYGLSKITEVLRLAGESDFLNGKNDRLFMADLEWLMRPNNFIKVMEGKYQNRTAGVKMTY
jgi:hypothetical protein